MPNIENIILAKGNKRITSPYSGVPIYEVTSNNDGLIMPLGITGDMVHNKLISLIIYPTITLDNSSVLLFQANPDTGRAEERWNFQLYLPNGRFGSAGGVSLGQNGIPVLMMCTSLMTNIEPGAGLATIISIHSSEIPTYNLINSSQNIDIPSSRLYEPFWVRPSGTQTLTLQSIIVNETRYGLVVKPTTGSSVGSFEEFPVYLNRNERILVQLLDSNPVRALILSNANIQELPSGGNTGDVLMKTDNFTGKVWQPLVIPSPIYLHYMNINVSGTTGNPSYRISFTITNAIATSYSTILQIRQAISDLGFNDTSKLFPASGYFNPGAGANTRYTVSGLLVNGSNLQFVSADGSSVGSTITIPTTATVTQVN